MKTIKKKQKHKARGAVRTITKQVPADSFFNFFNPPIVEDEDKVNLDIQNVSDTQINFIKILKINEEATGFFTDLTE